jgi:hypothetical protein
MKCNFPVSLYWLSHGFFTEQVGSSSNACDFYSGGARFESRPEHRLSWMRFSWFSSVPPGIFLYSGLKQATTFSFHTPSNSLFTIQAFNATQSELLTANGATRIFSCGGGGTRHNIFFKKLHLNRLRQLLVFALGIQDRRIDLQI